MTLEQFKLKHYRILYKELSMHKQRMMAYRAVANPITLGFLDALEQEHECALIHLNARIQMLKPRPEGLPSHYVSPNDIAMAKMQSIRNYIPGKIVQNKTLCLFHADKNESMHVYDTSYYCFACGAKGDTIALIMKLKNCSFTVAVKFLLNK
jgi:hypothetical protein